MKPEIKKGFVKRLRNAQQTKGGILKKGNKFSSDGLLCQMYLEENWWTNARWDAGVGGIYEGQELFWINDYPHLVAPAEVESWAGIVNDFLLDGTTPYTLCQIDCTNEFTLAEIADLVEEQW